MKLKDYKANSSNPFLEELVNEVKIKKKMVQVITPKASVNNIVNPEGEVVGDMAARVIRKVDTDQFVKIYTAHIDRIYDLTRAARAVLTHIMRIMIPNKDFFYFEIDNFKDGTGYSSKAAIYGGIKELLEKDLIARSNSFYKFYINPLIYFNGNRAHFITTIEKKNKANEIE